MCSFQLVQSTLGEVANLYLEQQASDKAIDAAKSPEEFLIMIPRGMSATARRGADRHRIATSECSGDSEDISGFIVEWLGGYERLYTAKAEAGRRFLLGEIDVAQLKVALAENVASLDAHWKNLPQLIVAVSLATVGSDPLRPNGTALRLTAEQKQQLLSGIDSTCSTLGGCSDESLKGRGIPAAVAAHRLMTQHLMKPWALNGTELP
jgi:hypothetical protein